MGEEDYPWYHPLYKPTQRKKSMKEIRDGYNKYLEKFSKVRSKR